MDNEIPVRFDFFLGHAQLVTTSRIEDGNLLLGGYSINYDQRGREFSRTADRVNVVVHFG